MTYLRVNVLLLQVGDSQLMAGCVLARTTPNPHRRMLPGKATRSPDGQLLGAVSAASSARTRAAGPGATSHFRWLPSRVRT
ncbi:hypothetical protein B5181_20575, partial [Streptomyces sp. 4F]